ncbi:MAG: hypothetical protein ACON4C_03335 [Henriciella sp.]|jgi:hypothetical protein
MLSAVSLIAIALAVFLSALIRLLQIMQLRQRVRAGLTGVRELAELSGITEPKDLQDVFGPPGLDRVWSHITLKFIEQKRRMPGYFLSDHRLHWACLALMPLCLVIQHWSTELLLMIALLIQAGAWLSATRLPK